MRTFSEKSRAIQPNASTSTRMPGRTRIGQSRDANSIFDSPATIWNRDLPQVPEANFEGNHSSVTEAARFGHDFSRIPVHADTPAATPGVTTRTPQGYDLQTAGRDGNDTEPSALDSAPMPHDFGMLRILPIMAPPATDVSNVDIPRLGGNEEIVDQPPGDGGTHPPTPAESDSCGQPTSMDKITSGAFLGGLTMNSYYPDLTGRGYYDHPGTSGTFDTGSRVGANVQFIGAIPSPCKPTAFHLEQTVTRTRYRINGAINAEEGRTFDDLAKSGRNISTAPFRQDFLGGGAAPLGYIISMADPPSTGYNSTTSVEHDRDFVTSLVGPNGRQSVSWSLSTRIARGTVTTNTLT